MNQPAICLDSIEKTELKAHSSAVNRLCVGRIEADLWLFIGELMPVIRSGV